jgi:ABC-type transporter lipoprotein component MlaA
MYPARQKAKWPTDYVTAKSVPQSSGFPKSSLLNAPTFEKIEDRKTALNAKDYPLSAPNSYRLVRKEYRQVRNRTVCIAREFPNFQDFPKRQRYGDWSPPGLEIKLVGVKGAYVLSLIVCFDTFCYSSLTST